MTINLTALQKQRRDTAANWTGANPTLLAGEIGIESDTNKIKLGNGSTAWTSLGYTTWSQISAYPIVNADVAAAAAISYSKLATLTSGNIVLGSSGNVATSTAVTGDVTIGNTGVTAIAAGVIVDADVNASAAIAGTKILPNFGSQTIITTGSGLIGTATALSTTYAGTGKFQVASNNSTVIQTYAFDSTGAAYAPGLELVRARGTQASPVIVNNGDYLGEINFYGYNTDFRRAASIHVEVNGTPGSSGDVSDIPGKLIFSTTPDGSATPSARMTIDNAGLVTIPGDLTVNGTTTTINSTTLVVQDKNIEMGVVATPTDVTADGGGITLKGTTDKTINWVDATDAWTFSEHVNIASAKEYRIAGTKVLDATSLGSAVVSSSLTSVGTISAGVWNGTAISDTYLGTISTALKVSNSATTATDANTASAIVARNASGNFTAGTITAALTGNASTVTTNANLTGHVTSVGNAAVLGSFTSAQLATALTDETGSGAAVFATSPTFVTPALGTPSSGTLTNCTFPTLNQNTTGTAAGLSATLAVASGGTGVTNSTGSGSVVLSASPTFTGTVTIPTGASITAPTGLVKGDVGLGNVDNTSNATERAATATLTNKTLTSPVINTPTGIVKGDVGLGNVDNTTDANKPVSTATQTALDLKANLASPTFTGTVTAPTFSGALTGNAATVTTNANLTGDVTSTGNATSIAAGVIVDADVNASAAIVDTKLATISTAGKVSNSATTATNANTASAIVARDASGNFTAGTITAALTGAASSNVLKAGDTMTGVLAVTAGTAALPAITPSGDPNTGIYSPGADQLAISTGGTGRLTVQADGNVLIGATGSATRLLTVNQTGVTGGEYGIGVSQTSATSNAVELTIDTDNGTSKLFQKSTIPLVFGTNDQERLRIRADGTFEIKGFGTAGSSPGFSVNPSTPANSFVIDSSGRLGIGTSSPIRKLHVAVDGADPQLRLQDTSASESINCAIEFYGDFGRQAYIGKAGSTDLLIHNDNASGALRFSTNATERVRLDASGRLLVGASSARANFYNSTNSARFQIEGSGSNDNYALSIVSNYAGNTNGAQVILAKSGGANVGDNTLIVSGDTIGQINFQGADGTEFVEAAFIRAEVDGTPGANDMPGRLVFSTTADGAASPTERMRISSAGAILFGKTSNAATVVGAQIEAVGTITSTRSGSTSSTSTLEVYSTGAAAYRFYVGMDGTVNATNTTISAISDQRLKENIRDLDVGLNEILALKPRVFDWKKDKGKNIKNDRGFVAQEFEEVFPELVDEWKDPAPEGEDPYKSVRQDLIPVLVKAIQEQQIKIKTLEAAVTALQQS